VDFQGFVIWGQKTLQRLPAAHKVHTADADDVIRVTDVAKALLTFGPADLVLGVTDGDLLGDFHFTLLQSQSFANP
jgi:hypothetical protein